MSIRSKSAFTLIEAIIVLVIIGLVAAVAIPAATGYLAGQKEKEAIARAQILDLHKGTYLTENGAGALTAWAGAITDEDKYLIIRPFLTNPPASLGDGTLGDGFAPKGYRIALNGLAEASTVTRLSDSTPVNPGPGAGSSFSVTLATNNSVMGTVVGGGTYASNETVNVIAQPFSGHVFLNWTNSNDVVVSNSPSHTFVLTAQTHLKANFAVAPVGSYYLTLTRNSNFAGTVNPSSGSITAGANVALSATPNPNYVFDNWTGDIGGANPSSSSIQLTMDRDRLVQANFVRVSVTLALSPNNPSWGSVSGAGSYPSGHTVAIVATAYPGYRFVRWLDGATPISSSTTHSYAVNGNVALTGEFEADPVTGVIAGTYGSPDKVSRVSVDAQGRVLGVEERAIAIDHTAVAGIGTMAQQDSGTVAITGGSISGVSMAGTTFTAPTIVGGTIEGTPVGISNPAAGRFTSLRSTSLHVQGGSAGTAPAWNASDLAIFENPASAPNTNVQIFSATGSHGGLRFSRPDNRSIGGVYYDHLNDALSFTVNNTDRIRIDKDGLVGVGGTPTTGFGKLQVMGGNIQTDYTSGLTIMDDAASPRFVLKRGEAGTTGGSNHVMLTNRAMNGDTIIGANNGAPSTEIEAMRVKAVTGRVGINNTNPQHLLDVNGDIKAGSGDWSGFYANAGGAIATLRIAPAAAYGQVIGFTGTDSNQPFAIRTNSNIAAWFATNGNVGFGTTNPTEKLHVAGGARIEGPARVTSVVQAEGYLSPYSGTNSGAAGGPYVWGYQEAGAWVHPYPDLVIGYHTGLKIGAQSSYGGVRFYNDHPSMSSTEIMSVGNGDNHVRVANNLYVNGSLVLAVQGEGSGLNADLLDGYNSSVATAGSTVVVRDGSGHINGQYGFFNYLNMSHGASGSTTDTVFYSSGDDYIRKNNATGFRASLNVPTRTGGDASGTWGINVTGTSGGAPWSGISGKPQAGDWTGKNTFVSEMMSWKNYGNGHVIFDASQGTNPGGGALPYGNTNPQSAWSPSYPTLMGWNGSSTYGVRVDSARVADTVSTISGAQVTTALGYTPVNKAGDTMNGNLGFSNYGLGMVGVYSDTRYQGVFSMGPGWVLPADGSTPGNLYGMAWTHSNIGGQSKSGLGHQFLIMENGVTQSAIGNGIWTRANIQSLGNLYVSMGGTTGGGIKLADDGDIVDLNDGYASMRFSNGVRIFSANAGGSSVITLANNGVVIASTFNAMSSRRFKENIVPLDPESTLDKVLKLRPVTYDWKAGHSKGGHDFGFIAEEVDALFPEVVSKDQSGETTGVDYGRLSAVLASSVQSLNTENRKLKARIETFEDRFEALERKGPNFSMLMLLAALLAGGAGGALTTVVLIRGKKF